MLILRHLIDMKILDEGKCAIYFSNGPPFFGCQGELFFFIGSSYVSCGSEYVLEFEYVLTGLGLPLSPAIIKIIVIINGIIRNTA